MEVEQAILTIFILPIILVVLLDLNYIIKKVIKGF